MAIAGVMPLLAGSARVILPSLRRVDGPMVFVLPSWSAMLLALSFVVIFVLVAGALRFASIARPLLILVAGAWTLHATGFWRVGLPVDRLVGAESVGAMFRLTTRNFHEDWQIGGRLLGWMMLIVVLVVAVAVEIILSRRKVASGTRRHM
jgi:hypothetical protein